MKNKDKFRWLQKGVSDSIGCDPERLFSLIEFLKNCCSVNAGYNNYCVGDKDYIRIPVWGGFTKGITIQINGIMPGMAPDKQKFTAKRDRTWSESRDRSVSFWGPFILSESETFLWCLPSVSVDFLKAKLLAMSLLQSQSLCLNNAFQLIELWLSWLFEEKIEMTQRTDKEWLHRLTVASPNERKREYETSVGSVQAWVCFTIKAIMNCCCKYSWRDHDRTVVTFFRFQNAHWSFSINLLIYGSWGSKFFHFHAVLSKKTYKILGVGAPPPPPRKILDSALFLTRMTPYA